MSQARGLYRLQETELEIIAHTKRIKAINAQLADDADLKRVQAQFDAAQSSLQAIARRIRQMEGQIEAVVSKRQATETRLYSGNVKNPKELQDMQMEVEALTRRRAELDDRLLMLMMEREEAQQALDEGERELKGVQSEKQAEQQDLLKEKSGLTGKAEQLMTERRSVLKQIQPDILKTYSSLRTAKANRPVSLLKDKACGACGIQQNNAIIASIHRADQLVKCHSCGRILIRL